MYEDMKYSICIYNRAVYIASEAFPNICLPFCSVITNSPSSTVHRLSSTTTRAKNVPSTKGASVAGAPLILTY